MATEYRPSPLDFPRLNAETQLERMRDFAAWMRRRRTVRHFSPEPVPIAIIDSAIAVASSAPSGANRQPWTFVVSRPSPRLAPTGTKSFWRLHRT